MINLEPTIADSALGKFQSWLQIKISIISNHHYLKGNIVLIILIYYQRIQNLQVKMKK